MRTRNVLAMVLGLVSTIPLSTRAGAADAEITFFGSISNRLAGQSGSEFSSTTSIPTGLFLTQPPGTTSLATHLGFNVNADAGTGGLALELGILSYRVEFTVSHGAAYDVTIAVELNGELRRSVDSTFCLGAVSLPDVMIPTLRRRSDGALFPLDIVLTGAALELGGGDASVELSAQGVKTVPLRNQARGSDRFVVEFDVFATALSQSCEVSARFGTNNGNTASCSACEYPGDGARVLSDDGIDVAVIIDGRCGDGVVDGGEECDAGPLNGMVEICCDGECLLRAGTSCRPAVDGCDREELCDGASAMCPEDQRKTFGSFCTDDQNDCTDDVCNSNSVCVHLPAEGASCEDGLFCDGEELCSAEGQCAVVIPPPCPQAQCDEGTDTCALVTPTPTPTSTPTLVASGTATSTPTPLASTTATATSTLVASSTTTATPTPVASGTATATPTPPVLDTPTITATPRRCPGDCNANLQVTIDELVLGVGIALGGQPVSACPPFDTNADGSVAINELIAGVNSALTVCNR